jgi:hypothetical protein
LHLYFFLSSYSCRPLTYSLILSVLAGVFGSIGKDNFSNLLNKTLPRFWQQRQPPTSVKLDNTPAYECRTEICHVDVPCSGIMRGPQLYFAFVTPLTISTGMAQIEILSKWSLHRKEPARQQPELPYLRCSDINDINTNKKILDNVASYLFCSLALPYC